MKEWIIVASRAEAKIFKRNNKIQNLEWLETLKNTKGRWKERDFENDKPGSSHAKYSAIRSPHSLQSHVSHAEAVANHFSYVIGKILNKSYHEGRFKKATIFAEPKLLGKIKKEIQEPAICNALTFITKNIEKASTDQIQKYMTDLPEVL